MGDRGQNGQSRLSAEQAFVVHLLETEAVYGRVEHVSSGRCMRFGSVAELIEFMRGTLRIPCSSEDETVA